ncbi:hypothetical protein NPX13_g9048 [Xylaria arbuscula]|uniref:Uncharacterized protein n=1 Tax=Xylaria arbuscula TaxID=114810 RepID=A0A9W8TJ94_9PEZI|nr:hypothetical protein NPX13_g9048 [Xylaria arbuscula]
MPRLGNGHPPADRAQWRERSHLDPEDIQNIIVVLRSADPPYQIIDEKALEGFLQKGEPRQNFAVAYNFHQIRSWVRSCMNGDEVIGIAEARLAKYGQIRKIPVDVRGFDCITLYVTVQAIQPEPFADNGDEPVAHVPISAGEATSSLSKGLRSTLSSNDTLGNPDIGPLGKSSESVEPAPGPVSNGERRNDVIDLTKDLDEVPQDEDLEDQDIGDLLRDQVLGDADQDMEQEDIVDLTDNLLEEQVVDDLKDPDKKKEKEIWELACSFTGHKTSYTDPTNPEHLHRFKGVRLPLKPHQLWAVTRILFTHSRARVELF